MVLTSLLHAGRQWRVAVGASREWSRWIGVIINFEDPFLCCSMTLMVCTNIKRYMEVSMCHSYIGFQFKAKDDTRIPHLFRVRVVQNEYIGEKRQRITVRIDSSVDYAVEARY